MNKKYYLVKLDSYENYYRCTSVYKAIDKRTLINYLEEYLASDQIIVSIEEVDFENNQEEILKQVSPEKDVFII